MVVSESAIQYKVYKCSQNTTLDIFIALMAKAKAKAFRWWHTCNTALTYLQPFLVDLTPPKLAVPTIYIITYTRLLLYIVMVIEILSSNHTAATHIVQLFYIKYCTT